jgi:hypothetical protein
LERAVVVPVPICIVFLAVIGLGFYAVRNGRAFRLRASSRSISMEIDPPNSTRNLLPDSNTEREKPGLPDGGDPTPGPS